MSHQIIHDELWQPGAADMLIVTTNGRIKADGALTMGRGAAFEATQHIPNLA